MDQRMDQCQGGLHYLSMNLDRVELFGSHMFIEHRLDLGIVDRQAVRSLSPPHPPDALLTVGFRLVEVGVARSG